MSASSTRGKTTTTPSSVASRLLPSSVFSFSTTSVLVVLVLFLGAPTSSNVGVSAFQTLAPSSFLTRSYRQTITATPRRRFPSHSFRSLPKQQHKQQQRRQHSVPLLWTRASAINTSHNNSDVDSSVVTKAEQSDRPASALATVAEANETEIVSGLDDDNEDVEESLKLKSVTTSETTASSTTAEPSAVVVDAALEAPLPSVRELLVYAGSTVLIWLSEPLLSLIDTTVLSQSRPIAAAGASPSSTSSSIVVQLAALGPATTLTDSLLYLTYVLAMATTNQMAATFAAYQQARQAQQQQQQQVANHDNNHDDAARMTAAAEASSRQVIQQLRNLQRTASHVLGVATVMGVGVSAVVAFAGRSLLRRMMTSASETAILLDYASQYTNIRMSVSLFAVLGMTAQSLCLASLRTRPATTAMLAASVVNVVGDLWLCPRMGLRGAALATAAATTVSAVILLRAVQNQLRSWRKLEKQERATLRDLQQQQEQQQQQQQMVQQTGQEVENVLPSKNDNEKAPEKIPLVSWPDRKSLWRLMSLMGPLGFVLTAKIICYGILTVRTTAFGTQPMACQSILMRLWFLFACCGDGIEQTAQSYLPIYYKRNQEGKKSAETATAATPSSSRKGLSAFSRLLRRLLLLAVTVGSFNACFSCWLLRGSSTLGQILTTDAGVRQLLSEHSVWFSRALFFHPLTMCVEGMVLAKGLLGGLWASYALTTAWQWIVVQGWTPNYAAVWRAFGFFQIARLVIITGVSQFVQRKTEDNPSTAVPTTQ